MKKLLLTLVACFSIWISRADVQFSYVNPATHEIRITNYSLVDVDITNYRLCALFQYTNLSQPAVSVLSGDFNLAPNEEVAFTWNPGTGFNATASDLGLYLPSGGFNDPANMVDFMQYGSGGLGRENVAVAAGMWSAGTFLLTPGPWFYVGGNPSMINTWAYLPDFIDVTFKVDMSQQSISPDGVRVTGSFQGWDPTTALMEDLDADGIYEYEASIDYGSIVQYKFINGDSFGEAEVVPGACGVDDGFGGMNRSIELNSAASPDLILDVVCFGECAECSIIVEPLTVDVTFQVNMQNETVSPNGVHIAGDFQGWNAASSEMTDVDMDGIYEITAAIDTNSTIQYVFINGNTFGDKEIVPIACGVDDGFGGVNRTAEIGEADVTLDLVCFGECTDCEVIVEPLTVDVTFQVNMQNETVSPNGVHIAGNFQGWNAGSSELTDVDMDGIYEITAAIDTNSTIQYVFINGNTFGDKEIVPIACGVDDGFGGVNRTAAIGETNVTFDAVCFGECTDCEVIVEPLTVDVTFQVNMQNETVSPNGVHIAGNFQGWNAGSSELTDVDMDGIYEITVAIDTNSTIQYVFINGNTFGDKEIVPIACGVDDGFGGVNRTAAIGETNVTFDAVCFGECTDCEVIVEPLTVDVTFQVNMQNETVSPNGVHIAGDFQGWNAASSEMTDVDMDGIYEITAAIDTNSTIQYVFINGNTFGDKEIVPIACGVDDGFGGVNRTAAIGETNVTFDAVCFGECTDCEVIVEPLTVDVTFQVNMQNETVSPNGVHIAGNFQGWNAASSEMTDVDMDGIYEITVAIDTNSTIQYVFINGNTFGDKEIVPIACGVDDGFGGVNRTAAIGETNVTFDAVCFGECTDCEVIVEPSTVMVTFNVNMIYEVVALEGVHIFGNYQNGNNALTPMTDINGDGTFEITLELDTNATIWYKFVNGNTAIGEEVVPAECGTDIEIVGMSRTLNTTEEDMTLTSVCFGECANCPGASNLITLQVNMANEIVSPDGVHVVGNFQGWDSAASPMTDDDADGIYVITFEADEWANLNYKFINGNTFEGAEIVPSGCGLPDGFGGFNRILETGSNDFTASPVCFGECENCEIQAILVDVTFLVNMANETVSADGVHIAGNFQGFDPASSTMTDDNADGIYEITLPVESNTNAEFRFINGNDFAFAEVVPADCGVPNGFGQNNRTFAVGAVPATFGPVCFSACVDCDDIVEPTTVPVTFLVNMNNEGASANGVHVAGSFQNWNPATSQMTDTNLDGIYSFTADVPVNSTIQFKFINGNDWPFQESVPADCGVSDGFGGMNRSLSVGDAPVTFGPVCFAACEDCAPLVPVLVTLRVDMSNQTVSPDGVFIAGSFNNWNIGATPMSEYETDHYQAVVVLSAGETVSYKFINGLNWTGSEVVPSDCGVPDGFGGFNRGYNVGVDNETLPLVCFSECGSCSLINMVDVTFQVDMGQIVADPTGIFIAGSFNGFSASANPMTLIGSNVYSTTISVQENIQVTFKYLNGSSFPGVETVPFECGVDDGFGGYNRAVNVDNADVTLPEVCFGSCVDCPVNVEETMMNDISIYPNPASGQFSISLANAQAAEFIVYDATGKLVLRERIMSQGIVTVNTESWHAGLYQIVIPGVGSRNVIVE